ncbi:MAG: diguanylate cyclase [Candidatus Omnitrophota bacterium]|jgi:diguanylate cyclase (GGDEF)-like protein
MEQSIKKVLIVSSEKNLLDVLNFCFDGWGYEVHLYDHTLQDIALIKKIAPDVVIVDVHSANKPQLEICRLIKNDFLTASIPVITLINKRQLRSHLLNIKQGVDDYLIKPPDPLDLRVRVEMAIKRSQYSLNAHPLTGLPGGRIIEETLQERLKKEAHFTFGYIDIDNFKYFNDVYGYVRGDMVIMQTAYTLYTLIKKLGNHDDFIGHIGGDDFMFITTPEKYKEICRHFIASFDRLARAHYAEGDRNQGFVVTKDRTHKIKQMPLMSVSVALVNKNNSLEFKSILEINDRIVEIKRYLKSIAGSKFMADRRDLTGLGTRDVESQQKETEGGLKQGKLLGQLLIERNMISCVQLDEALKAHWKRGIILGEVLKELGYIKERELEEVLKCQEHELIAVKSPNRIQSFLPAE